MSAVKSAVRKQRRLRHDRILAKPYTGEVLSINDDYTDAVTDVPHLLRERRALGAGVQEGKGRDYRARLPDRYGVRQRLASDATSGVAVVWDREQAGSIGGTRNRPGMRGTGWVPIIEPRRGDPMLTRGVIWQDLQVIETGLEFRLAAYHRPPGYLSHLWEDADETMRAFLLASPIPVHVLTDNNSRRPPAGLPSGMRWRGSGIDGSLGDVPVLSTYALAYLRSDHRAVSQALDLRDR